MRTVSVSLFVDLVRSTSMYLSLHNGRLRTLDPVQFVVRSVLHRMRRGAHRLLAHLALVHVSRTLVVVTVRCHGGDLTEHHGGSEFHVSGFCPYIGGEAGDVHEYLFHGADPLGLAGGEVHDGADESARLGWGGVGFEKLSGMGGEGR